MKSIKYSFLVLLFIFSSCSGFLDETPDDRTTVDSQKKLRKLLVSAYCESYSALLTELSSDNILDEGEANTNGGRVYEDMTYWRDIKQSQNDDPESFWSASYSAISNANLAIDVCNTSLKNAKAEKAEALMARAFAHFMLVNVFSKHYNPATADSDLGIVYMEKSETVLDPKYKRESVASVYKKIERDIEEALPNISDDIYEQPKFHFNKNAAYAFATRFYLYYGKWEKAVKCANKVLNSGALVNWGYIGSLPNKHKIRAEEYYKQKGSLLLLSDVTNMRVYFNPFYTGARYNHIIDLSDRETMGAPMPWGILSYDSSYKTKPFVINSNSNFRKVSFPAYSILFEETDPVQGIGFFRSIHIPFTVDDVLLMRAEANIHLQKYNQALSDINKWTSNYFKGNTTVDLAKVQEFYNKIEYSSTSDFDKLTQKKKLNPLGFIIKDQEQENMLHFVLQCRRILNIHNGKRWFDVKRYGIEVARFQKQKNEKYELQDVLKVGDNRRALQLPLAVISAGLEANPR